MLDQCFCLLITLCASAGAQIIVSAENVLWRPEPKARACVGIILACNPEMDSGSPSRSLQKPSSGGWRNGHGSEQLQILPRKHKG